jgi:hypothetical protein
VSEGVPVPPTPVESPIVGLQRSGSTLLEQILSSHPHIEGASELLAMQQAWAGVEWQAAANRRTPLEQVAAFGPSAIRSLGAEHLERTSRLPALPASTLIECSRGPFIALSTGHLVEDPEASSRMLRFIGVPYDSACLEFHRKRRTVPTPSAEQVRWPIYLEGRDAWRSYESWPDPLKEALGPALNE